MKFSFGFFALERKSKLIQITNSKNSNRNLFGLSASIICQQYFVNYCLILNVRYEKKWEIFISSRTIVKFSAHRLDF